VSCRVCARYDQMGYGGSCPCPHVDGKCVAFMDQEMYSVYDRKLREYGHIVLSPNRAAVARSLQMGVRGSGSVMEKYPGDFELHKVGTFNTSTGEVTANGRPEVLTTLDVILEA